jgi:hypothetical protein
MNNLNRFNLVINGQSTIYQRAPTNPESVELELRNVLTCIDHESIYTVPLLPFDDPFVLLYNVGYRTFVNKHVSVDQIINGLLRGVFTEDQIFEVIQTLDLLLSQEIYLSDDNTTINYFGETPLNYRLEGRRRRLIESLHYGCRLGVNPLNNGTLKHLAYQQRVLNYMYGANTMKSINGRFNIEGMSYSANKSEWITWLQKISVTNLILRIHDGLGAFEVIDFMFRLYGLLNGAVPRSNLSNARDVNGDAIMNNRFQRMLPKYDFTMVDPVNEETAIFNSQGVNLKSDSCVFAFLLRLLYQENDQDLQEDEDEPGFDLFN